MDWNAGEVAWMRVVVENCWEGSELGKYSSSSSSSKVIARWWSSRNFAIAIACRQVVNVWLVGLRWGIKKPNTHAVRH